MLPCNKADYIKFTNQVKMGRRAERVNLDCLKALGHAEVLPRAFVAIPRPAPNLQSRDDGQALSRLALGTSIDS